jgi:hypothetical protein
VEFAEKIIFFHGQFFEMGFEDGIGEVKFAEFLVVVDLFIGLLFFGCDLSGMEAVLLFGVDFLLDLVQRRLGLLLGWIVGVHAIGLSWYLILYYYLLAWISI